MGDRVRFFLLAATFIYKSFLQMRSRGHGAETAKFNDLRPFAFGLLRLKRGRLGQMVSTWIYSKSCAGLASDSSGSSDSKSSTAGSPAFLSKISTFCSASFRAVWQVRVSMTPRSCGAGDSSRGNSPCSHRSTSSSSSRMAVSKSSLGVSFGVRVAMTSNGTGAAQRAQVHVADAAPSEHCQLVRRVTAANSRHSRVCITLAVGNYMTLTLKQFAAYAGLVAAILGSIACSPKRIPP